MTLLHVSDNYPFLDFHLFMVENENNLECFCEISKLLFSCLSPNVVNKLNRDSELLVKVHGPRPENILFLVHEVFEGLITESFQGVSYDFLIPCPDCLFDVSMFF